MKLSPRLAGVYLDKAELVASKGVLRFGQSLWNMLPPEVVQPYHGTTLDFFYCENKRVVLKLFYTYMVEGEHNDN